MKTGLNNRRGGSTAAEAPRTSPTPAERSAGAADGEAGGIREHLDRTDAAHVAATDEQKGRRLVEEAFKSGTLKTPAQWEEEPDKPKVAIWEGVIKQGESFAFVAQAKKGKSHLAMQLGLHVGAGRPLLGRECLRSKVYLALAENDEQENKERWKRIMEAGGFDVRDIEGYVFFDNLASVQTTFDEVRLKCKALGATVAIVDPFYLVAKIVETDEQSCLDAIEQMLRFKRDGITLGIVFHSPKGFSGDRSVIDQIAGSSFFARYVATIIAIQGHATDRKARVMDFELRNFEAIDPFSVTLKGGVFELAPDIPPEVATSRNAYKRNEAQVKADADDILPYAVEAIKQARDFEGEQFVGMTQGACAAKVGLLMQTDGKPHVGVNTIKALLDLLPKDRVTCKKIGKGKYYNLAKGVQGE